MATDESTMFADSIVDKLERIVSCLDGQSPDEINMLPPIPETNSLLVLAVHTMANVEEATFKALLGQQVNRNRDAEFAASGSSAEEVRKQWEELKARIHPALAGLTPDQLSSVYEHPRRGPMSGRELLLFTATHASEHVGHAEMTRDWIISQR
ncbi:MAG: DinB family protein [Thermomicrobiaceae bacterium]